MNNNYFRELKKIQEDIDKQSFFVKDKRYSELKPIDFLKHNCFHLSNLVAKISKVCEQDDHDNELSKKEIIDEVIPDLIIYALQFSNVLDVDLDKKIIERQNFVLNKYPEKNIKL